MIVPGPGTSKLALSLTNLQRGLAKKKKKGIREEHQGEFLKIRSSSK
jgi:hypothetical protein